MSRLTSTYRTLSVFIILWMSSALQAQTGSQAVDSTGPPTKSGAIVRSLILPGWGQIYQERLTQGALLYATSATFYYRTVFHYWYYKKNGSEYHYQLFKTNLSVAGFLYLINLLDVSDAAIHEKPRGWQGGLLNNRPLKSPWGAVLRSAILPGWGQVYDRAYWKAAGYLAVDGYLFYRAHQADRKYRDTGQTRFREEYSKFSWYFGAAYLLTLADAYAGAYLFKFDQAMRLTVHPDWGKSYLGIRAYVVF